MNESISIYELSRLLNRKEHWKNIDTIKLARYLIEPRFESFLEYNKFLEEQIFVVLGTLSSLLYEYPVSDTKKIESIKNELALNVDGLEFKFKRISNEDNEITLEAFEDMFYNMKPMKKCYCIKMMDERNKDYNKLNYLDLINVLKTSKEQDKINSNNDEESKKHDELASNSKQIDVKSSSISVQNSDDIQDNEIGIVQECIEKLAQYLKENNASLKTIFPNVLKINVDGELVEAIKSDCFLSKLKELVITNLTDLQNLCLLKCLTLCENEDYIKVDDLEQLLQSYGVQLNSYREIELDYNKLDGVSMILLLALSEYILKENVSIYELFSEIIHTQLIDSKAVEYIESKDFFVAMYTIDIRIDSEPHQNLEDFLKLEENSSKLDMNKLKKAIETFAINNKLRSKAKEYYKEFTNTK